MTHQTCPNDETLLAVLAGALPAEDEQQLTTHVENCPHCEHSLERLNRPAPGRLEAEVLAAGGRMPKAAGRYQLSREVARGGMGVVYVASDPAFGRDVAVKLLHHHLGTYPEAKARFLEEAKLTSRLDHPGVPAVHDIGELPDGRPFLVMKLISGRTLSELFQCDNVSRESLLPTVLSVCQTVGFAHARGIVHRDLKPANVMVGSFGEVQVLDWGLAKSASRSESQPAAAAPAPEAGSGSVSGSAVGSAPYASPEQARGLRGEIGSRSDVFSLGAILAEWLTGQPPHTGPDAWEAARRGDTSGVRARLARSNLAPELHPLVLLCLDADPENRPADANVVAARINDYLSDVRQRVQRAETDRQVAVGKAGVERRTNRTLRRLLAVISVLAASVVAAVATGYVAVKRQAAETARREHEAVSALDAERKALAVSDQAVALLSGNVVKNLLSQFDKIGPDQMALVEQIGKVFTDLSNVKRDSAAALETTAVGHYRLADFYTSHDKFQEAEPHIDLAIEQFQRLIGIEATEERYRHLAASYNDRNHLRKQQGRDPEADISASIRTWTTIVEKYPARRNNVWDLAIAEANLGNWYFTTGRYAESIRAYQTPIGRLREHAAKHPDEPRYRNTLAVVLGNQSDACRDSGDMVTALRSAEEGRELALGVAAAHPGVVQYAHRRAELDTKLTHLYLLCGRRSEAAERGREAVSRLTRVVDRLKARLDFQLSLVEAQVAYGRVLELQSEAAEAEKLFSSAAERLTMMAAESAAARYRDQLISVHLDLAKFYANTGRKPDARKQIAEAQKRLTGVAAETSPDRLVLSAGLDILLAELERGEGKEEDARGMLARARQSLGDARAVRPFGVAERDTEIQLLTMEVDAAMRRNDFAAARKSVPPADDHKRLAPSQSIRAARLYAKCLARPADAETENDAAAAFSLLSGAKAQGWTAWERVEKDDAFRPLVARPEFQKLRMK